MTVEPAGQGRGQDVTGAGVADPRGKARVRELGDRNRRAVSARDPHAASGGELNIGVMLRGEGGQRCPVPGAQPASGQMNRALCPGPVVW